MDSHTQLERILMVTGPTYFFHWGGLQYLFLLFHVYCYNASLGGQLEKPLQLLQGVEYHQNVQERMVTRMKRKRNYDDLWRRHQDMSPTKNLILMKQWKFKWLSVEKRSGLQRKVHT
mmetsp:Transcript_8690/g.18368  ORF Transcript_8690/g.18368 Transcript_8690/m.18368 type:complete len:117 (-) Transcript_8690:126-476(-)